MSITATLKVVLLANDVPVAESQDPSLWQQVLSRINGATKAIGISEPDNGFVGESEKPASNLKGDGGLAAFAAQLGVEETKLLGACTPSINKPYLHLDAHYWAAFRSNFPGTGRRAVSGTVLAATLLVLWQRHAGLDRVDCSDVQRILETVNGDSNSIARSIRRCSWLQLRDDQVRLNPAEIGRAESIARAFCLKEPETVVTNH